ncbi:AhpC/TSA family protein [Flavobacterium sp. WLB]|uniref:peroxiredoxin-like family protein n=1 Tax=unclassified Flavobacterium TaxID=196869 RepID=UPI0006AB8A2F|nr:MULTISPECIES: peroxiredoxin-like family protein [unclassified Flavobacterium]KOP39378.1 antioxidant AhpC [Flavobacterium sp. VMW]OWU91655.1 antioxidant AhpC [Flavobacterium sp. NLM]PUU70216.1 AhpC/TSA family protein [Flavobacterium sp. WLB]
MKKMLLIFVAALTSAAHAQSEIPKSALDIAPLLIGEKIPEFTLKTAENADVNLSELLKKKKTVLVFYRGGWCPYCNLHLQALAGAEKQIIDLGYQIIAVSPDSPENLKITEEKDKVKYTLLSDSKGELIKAVGIAYQVPENYKSVINVHSKGINTSLLPVPSVFVVNTEADILFEYISPDIKQRISTELLVSVLKNLK